VYTKNWNNKTKVKYVIVDLEKWVGGHKKRKGKETGNN
jgi:hypothetical protein